MGSPKSSMLGWLRAPALDPEQGNPTEGRLFCSASQVDFADTWIPLVLACGFPPQDPSPDFSFRPELLHQCIKHGVLEGLFLWECHRWCAPCLFLGCRNKGRQARGSAWVYSWFLKPEPELPMSAGWCSPDSVGPRGTLPICLRLHGLFP